MQEDKAVDEFRKDGQESEPKDKPSREPAGAFLMNWSQEEIDQVLQEMEEAAKDPEIPQPTVREKTELFKRIFGFEMELNAQDRERMACEDEVAQQEQYAESLQRRKEHYERLRFHWRVAAMLATVLITFSTASMMGTVGKGGADVVLNDRDEYTNVRIFDSQTNETYDGIKRYFVPDYVPEGYTLMFEDISDLGAIFTYCKEENMSFGDQNLIVETMTVDSMSVVDTEDLQRVEQAGISNGYLYTSDQKSFILLKFNDCGVRISGPINSEEILLMSESLSSNYIK